MALILIIGILCAAMTLAFVAGYVLGLAQADIEQ